MAAHGFDGFEIQLTFKFATQAADQHFDHVGVAFFVIRVELLDQSLLGHHLLLVAHQVFENTVLKGGQLQGFAIEQRLLAVEVEQKRASGNACLGKARGAAQQGVQARFQLFKLKGFDHVIIGTGGQAFDLVLPVATGGEYQNREALVLTAQLANQVQPAHAWQAEIDHRQVMVVFRSAVQRFFGIGHGIDHMALLAQLAIEVVTQQRFIFHDQQFHPSHSPNKAAGHGARPFWPTCCLELVVGTQVQLAAAVQVQRASLACAVLRHFGAGIGAQVAVAGFNRGILVDVLKNASLQT